MTMLDRVARAIADTPVTGEVTGAPISLRQSLTITARIHGIPWNEASFVSQMTDLARAAIEAMREPTEDMDQSGQTVCNDAFLEKEEVPADAHFVWKEMIDGALNHNGRSE